MGESEDTIARAVITAFSALPAKSKPKQRPDCAEWVPLAGIALETGGGEMICVALAWVVFPLLPSASLCFPSLPLPLPLPLPPFPFPFPSRGTRNNGFAGLG